MFDFVTILIAVGGMLALCALTMIFVTWSGSAFDELDDLPDRPEGRLLASLRGALIPCLLVTFPALLAQALAVRWLPEGYRGTWWGSLLVAYAGSWLVYYAYQERAWRRRQETRARPEEPPQAPE